MSRRQLDGTPLPVNYSTADPQLLFVTTLREPSDRLLSAYLFFAITVRINKTRGAEFIAPSFHQWRENLLKMINSTKYRVGSSEGHSNMVRSNHIVWRFSGGLSASMGPPKEDDEWKSSFEIAVRVLSQFDLILPIDLMTKDSLGKLALQQLLGWNRFEAHQKSNGEKESIHVVTVGQPKNSNARDYFSKNEFQNLWDENWLDNILYYWCRAVFLARLHCKDALETST